MEVSGQFTPWPLYPQGKSPWYPLDRRLGRPQSQSGRGSEEENSQPLLGLKPLIIQSIAQCYTTELSWFLGDRVLMRIFRPKREEVAGEDCIMRSFITCMLHVILLGRSNQGG
jgi:hypothetical protein